MALSPDGSISGQLANKTKFTFNYPVDLQDPEFAQLLDRDNVQVTAPPARTSGPSATVDSEMVGVAGAQEPRQLEVIIVS